MDKGKTVIGYQNFLCFFVYHFKEKEMSGTMIMRYRPRVNGGKIAEIAGNSSAQDFAFTAKSVK